MKLPPARRRFILKYEWIIEALSALPALVGSLVGVLKLTGQFAVADERMSKSDGGHLDRSGLAWIWMGFVLAFAIAVVRAMLARVKGQANADKDSPLDLWGCCVVLRSMLIARTSQNDDSLRITIYRLSKGGRGKLPHLEKLIPYAAKEGQDGGELGEPFPISCGIVGRVAREKVPMVTGRESEDVEAFRSEMVSGWGFTKEQAIKLSVSRWSWMAVPLFDNRGAVAGVVYLDAVSKNYFDDAQKADVLAGCEAVKKFALERYP